MGNHPVRSVEMCCCGLTKLVNIELDCCSSCSMRGYCYWVAPGILTDLTFYLDSCMYPLDVTMVGCSCLMIRTTVILGHVSK